VRTTGGMLLPASANDAQQRVLEMIEAEPAHERVRVGSVARSTGGNGGGARNVANL
jgi:hypothetical protein